MQITNDIRYIGVNDHKIDLFEGQYPVPNGMAYNSYVILDEKIAVMDTVDKAFGEEWLARLEAVLDGRAPDYLVVLHMEPDHSANVLRFAERYPEATIVSSTKAFVMMRGFFGNEFAERRIIVTEGSTLSLGRHELSFVAAPMVHWPEVLFAYDRCDRILFSADAFGKFGALDVDEPWEDEARRYYIGIVGKYGVQVQNVLKKAAALDIAAICSLHGPILRDNLSHYLSLYDTWSSYRPEADGVTIAYASIYGNTKAAAELLCEKLRAKGQTVVLYDLARTDLSYPVADAFRYSTLVLASSTYNADVFPPMRAFIDHLTERNFGNRRVALMENGSWAPMAAKVMRGMLEGAKSLTIMENGVKITSALNAESRAQIEALCEEICF